MEKRIFFKKIEPMELRYLNSSRFKKEPRESKRMNPQFSKLMADKHQIDLALQNLFLKSKKITRDLPKPNYTPREPNQNNLSVFESNGPDKSALKFTKLQSKELSLLLKQNLKVKRAHLIG